MRTEHKPETQSITYFPNHRLWAAGLGQRHQRKGTGSVGCQGVGRCQRPPQTVWHSLPQLWHPGRPPSGPQCTLRVSHRDGDSEMTCVARRLTRSEETWKWNSRRVSRIQGLRQARAKACVGPGPASPQSQVPPEAASCNVPTAGRVLEIKTRLPMQARRNTHQAWRTGEPSVSLELGSHRLRARAVSRKHWRNLLG